MMIGPAGGLQRLIIYVGFDPHAVAIGMFTEFDHPVTGRTRLPRHPTNFHGTPAALGGPTPALGQHTDEVLAELGLGDRIDALRADGVVA
jgi:crotonobetainyl-CoA:carnitine CoA-transferase CaiB-like acyl-CoA transferase